MKHTACEQLMVASFYDELAPDVRGQFRTHLDGCASCKEKFDRLTTTLRRMEQRQRHEPDEAYWNDYWARLKPGNKSNGVIGSGDSGGASRSDPVLHTPWFQP